MCVHTHTCTHFGHTAAYEYQWARDQTHTRAVTQTAAVTTLDPQTLCHKKKLLMNILSIEIHSPQKGFKFHISTKKILLIHLPLLYVLIAG